MILLATLLGCRPASKASTSTAVPADAADDERARLDVVPRSHLCVTNGAVQSKGDDGMLAVHASTMRAVAGRAPSDVVEMTFWLHGPSVESTPLASGELRRQVGIKLRAENTCNVVYAMWNLERAGDIHVSVKRNAGMQRHEQCADRGYINVRANQRRQLPDVEPGERHVLRAALDHDRLRVWADGMLAWEGALPPEAFAFEGPAGVRSDNVDFDFELRIPHGARTNSTAERCP